MESVLSEETKQHLAGMVGRPTLCLDYGGGDGTLGNAFMGDRMCGFDIEQPCDVQGCGKSLPFKAGTFDCVLASAALHHLDDPMAGVAEIARVTKRGGRLVVFEVNDLHQHRWLSAFRKPKSWHDEDRPIKPGYIAALLSKHGYTFESEYMTPTYSNPSRSAKIQDVVGKLFGVHSYIIFRGVKCPA